MAYPSATKPGALWTYAENRAAEEVETGFVLNPIMSWTSRRAGVQHEEGWKHLIATRFVCIL